jgi:hypothetical protein
MKFEEFRKKAIAILEHCQPMKASELIEATGATGSGYGWLKKMVDAGDIIKADRWNYAMPGFKSVEPKPVEVEVIEEYRPRAAMTAPKKVAPITAIALPKSPIAPYLQEQKAEQIWAHSLRNANISDGMKNPSDVSKLSGNWRFFVVDIDLCGLGLMSVQSISERFKNYLEGKAKKNAPLVDPHDIAVFVADKIWEAKLNNDAILNPALKLQAQFWQCDRTYRNRLHEALIKSGKWFLTEVNALMSLAPSGGLSKDELDRYLTEYGDRQKVFLDEMLSTRQSQAKKVVAEEIGKALNVHQLPEAK